MADAPLLFDPATGKWYEWVEYRAMKRGDFRIVRAGQMAMSPANCPDVNPWFDCYREFPAAEALARVGAVDYETTAGAMASLESNLKSGWRDRRPTAAEFRTMLSYICLTTIDQNKATEEMKKRGWLRDSAPKPSVEAAREKAVEIREPKPDSIEHLPPAPDIAARVDALIQIVSEIANTTCGGHQRDRFIERLAALRGGA